MSQVIDLNRCHAGAWLAVAVIVLTGCAVKIETVENPIEIDVGEYARLYEAAIVVLRENGLTVDRQDYRFGTITAKAVGSPTLFEPWRKLNTTSDQARQSTINHQRRQVTVTLERDEDRLKADGKYLLRVEVVIERLVIATARLTGSTRGGRIIGNLSSVPVQWQKRGITDHYWRPIGRDPYLEQRLLAAIVRRSFNLPAKSSAPIS